MFYPPVPSNTAHMRVFWSDSPVCRTTLLRCFRQRAVTDAASRVFTVNTATSMAAARREAAAAEDESSRNLLHWASNYTSSATSRSNFSLFLWNISKSTQWIGTNVVQIFMVPRWYILLTLVILWLFLYRHQRVDVLVFYENILTTVRQIAVKMGSVIHGSQRMNCNNFDPLTIIFWFMTKYLLPIPIILYCTQRCNWLKLWTFSSRLSQKNQNILV